MATVSPPLLYQAGHVYSTGYTQEYIPEYVGEMSINAGSTVHPGFINQGSSVFTPVASFQVTPQTQAPPVGVLVPSVVRSFVPATLTITPQIFSPSLGKFVSVPLITVAAGVFAPSTTRPLSPPMLDSTAQVFSPTTKINTTASPALLSSTAQTFAPGIVAGKAALPLRIANPADVFVPSLMLAVGPSFVVIDQTVYAPAVTRPLTVQKITVTAEVFAPTVLVPEAQLPRYDPFKRPRSPRARVSGKNRSLIRRSPR